MNQKELQEKYNALLEISRKTMNLLDQILTWFKRLQKEKLYKLDEKIKALEEQKAILDGILGVKINEG